MKRAGKNPRSGHAASGTDDGPDAGEARLDFAREKRCGFPEFIYGEGKSIAQLREIIPAMLEHDGRVLVTRITPETGTVLHAEFAAGNYDPVARVFRIDGEIPVRRGRVAVVSAGTSDAPVAAEARSTLEFCGFQVESIRDVGVAGIDRLFASLDRIRSCDVCIVAAGMEGALPSVVAGLVAIPVIALPTSVGYGASFGGVAALLGMLNSCASGVTVVNIDNGFGAACAAIRILNQCAAEGARQEE